MTIVEVYPGGMFYTAYEAVYNSEWNVMSGFFLPPSLQSWDDWNGEIIHLGSAPNGCWAYIGVPVPEDNGYISATLDIDGTWDWIYEMPEPTPDAYETFKCPVETFRLNTVDNGIVAISGVNEFYTCDFTISAEQGTIENGDVWYLTLQGRGTYPALLVSGATIEIAGVTFADSLVFTASGDQLVQPLIAYSTEGTNTITIPSGLLSLGTATVILNAVHIPLTGKPSWYVKEA